MSVKTISRLPNSLSVISISIFSIFIFSIFIYGCKDEPVTVIEEDFDPPRFNWRSYLIPTEGFAGIWANDTGNIYIANNYEQNLYHIHNGITNIYNYGNYFVNSINGVSNNEVFLFGTKPYPVNTLILIKWNGADFEYYSADTTRLNGLTIKGFVIDQNNIWIGTDQKIYHFDNNSIYYYSNPNPNLLLKNLFLDLNNKLQFIAVRQYNETTLQQSLFEFRDTSFVLIYDETINPYNEVSILDEINGIKYGKNLNFVTNNLCIENFDGTTFTDYFCFNKKIIITSESQSGNPVGTSLQNFIAIVNTTDNQIFNPPTRSGVIHWNGSKPSSEFGVLQSGTPFTYNRFIIFTISESEFLVLQPKSVINNENSILYIGSKK